MIVNRKFILTICRGIVFLNNRSFSFYFSFFFSLLIDRWIHLFLSRFSFFLNIFSFLFFIASPLPTARILRCCFPRLGWPFPPRIYIYIFIRSFSYVFDTAKKLYTILYICVYLHTHPHIHTLFFLLFLKDSFIRHWYIRTSLLNL